MAWTDIKLNVWDRLSQLLSRIRTRSVMRTKGRYPGMEVLGLNGRAVYFEWNDGVLTWEAYENDGATILKGRVPVDSAWETKADKTLRGVFSETVKERETRIARRLEAEDVREWDSLKRGDYIRSRMGEGYVVSWLPTGEIVINMRKNAREGTRVDKSDISGVWNGKTKKWDRLE